MRKYLILTVTAGEGHNSMAKAIKEKLEKDPQNVVKLIDIFKAYGKPGKVFFINDGYSAACGVYACCNKLLYDKISPTDVRKGWWVDESLDSPLLEEISWNGVSGRALAELEIENIKMPFLPYTNVKFGMNSIGGTANDEDWPFIRVEEMILIQAEGLAKSGQEDEARLILENFVRT